MTLHLQVYCVYEYEILFSLLLINILYHASVLMVPVLSINKNMVINWFKLLQLLDAISRVACLGFEKSYRESIVLMTRSYLDKVKAVGAAENNNSLPSEATTERTEVCDESYKFCIICYHTKFY